MQKIMRFSPPDLSVEKLNRITSDASELSTTASAENNEVLPPDLSVEKLTHTAPNAPELGPNAGEEIVQEAADSPRTQRHYLQFLNVARQAKQSVSTRTDNFLATLPQLSLKQQNLLKQIHNLFQLLLRLLLMVRFVIFMMGIVLIILVYPGTRLQAVFLTKQAIVIPLVWICVMFADLIMSFVIDHYLNQWAVDAQLTNPQSKRYALRVSTYSPVLKGASTFVFIILGLYLTVLLFGIDTSVLASAGVAAIVVGFLSRNLLEDMLNGILILATDRYAIGDVISVANVGGFVENMNLYTTQVRGGGGRLITIPNGQVRLVENLTKDWSRVEFKVEIAATEDARQAMDVIEQVATKMQNEEEWQELILEPASILGVDQVAHSGTLIQVWIKTQPMKQWAVGREFRLRVKQAFDEAGIALGVPQREIWHRDHSTSEETTPAN